MRIRTVKPEFFTDSKVRTLKFHERLLFQGLWLIADDEGRMEEDHAVIKGFLFPSDKVSIAKSIDRLIDKGMLLRYETGGVKYLLVRNFKSHQVVNRPKKSRIPPPPTEENHGCVTDASVINHGKVSDESVRKGREGKGKEESFARSPDSVTQQVTCLSDALGNLQKQTERTNERAFPKSLEKLVTPATLRKLADEYPVERLEWALRRYTAAREKRKIESPGSYFMRIVRDDDQYERYMCDQLALGHEKARKHQEDLARKRYARKQEALKQKAREEDKEFKAYLDTVPVGVAQKLADYTLERWAAETGADLGKLRRRGHLLQRSVIALYETHVRTAWLEHDRPEEYKPEHLEPPGGAAPDGSPTRERGEDSSTTENTEKRQTTGEHR